MKKLELLLAKLPPPVVSTAAALFSLLAGGAVAVILDYVLYRIGFPSTPFIYVSF
jgi:hypothetical protein